MGKHRTSSSLGNLSNFVSAEPSESVSQLSESEREAIGKQIKDYRDLTNLTQSALAAHVGTSAATIGNAERGLSVVSLAMLKRITDAAGIVWKPAIKRPRHQTNRCRKRN